MSGDGKAEKMSVPAVVKCGTCSAYKDACVEARTWIEVSSCQCISTSTFCWLIITEISQHVKTIFCFIKESNWNYFSMQRFPRIPKRWDAALQVSAFLFPLTFGRVNVMFCNDNCWRHCTWILYMCNISVQKIEETLTHLFKYKSNEICWSKSYILTVGNYSELLKIKIDQFEPTVYWLFIRVA